MENIGLILKKARQELNKSFEEIHDQTRVSVEHLKNLENNEFDFLPETYVKSFLKSYSDALGLKANDILDLYQKIKIVGVEENDEELAVSKTENEPSQQAVVSIVATKDHAVTERNHFVEWFLGFAFVALIIGLTIIYSLYKSKLYVERPASFNINTVVEPTQFAEIELHQSSTNMNEKAINPLELEITAKENIWVSLKIDGQSTSQYTLAPKENLIWMAKKRFDITIGKMRTGRSFLQGATDFDAKDEAVSFTLASKDLENASKEAYKK